MQNLNTLLSNQIIKSKRPCKYPPTYIPAWVAHTDGGVMRIMNQGTCGINYKVKFACRVKYPCIRSVICVVSRVAAR